MKYFLILLLIFSTIFSGKTQSIKIDLNSQTFDEQNRKIQAVIPVFKYKSQPFEDPLLIGLETKKKAGTFYAKLPNLTGYKDTNYAYIFYGGVANRKDLPGYVLTVLVNNKRREAPCILWIDRNFNMDMTDDGNPDTLKYTDLSKDISFKNPTNTNAIYTVRISRFSFHNNTVYIGMLNDYYKDNSGTKQFVGADYSFKETRLNTIAGDYKLGNDSFRIALKDGNCNGIYTDEGVDIILISGYKSNQLNEISIPYSKKNAFFEKNGKHYDIESVDEIGKYIIIKNNAKVKIKNALVIGKKIKKFKFATSDTFKKKISIKKFKKKPTYLYVWRLDENNFMADTLSLRIIKNKYSDIINIVTLNYGEKPIIIKRMKTRRNINWLIGYSTAKINKKLFIENYPTGILTRKKLKVNQVGISPSELLLLLQENKI